MKKIVRVRKLNDIEEFDWEITFEDDTKINHKHEHFFDLIEKLRPDWRGRSTRAHIYM